MMYIFDDVCFQVLGWEFGLVRRLVPKRSRRQGRCVDVLTGRHRMFGGMLSDWGYLL